MRARLVVLLPVFVGLFISACARSDAGSVESGMQIVASEAGVRGDAAMEQFDRLVMPAVVFPDPAQRALYEPLPPESESGKRSYTFQLKSQPGMVADRHFHLITITWARAGTFVTKPGDQPLSGSGGPNGGFVDLAAQTDDGVFDVRVSEAMLLPDTVRLPNIDLARIVASQLRRYDQFKSH